MGSLSFGISELINEPVDGWFKLLNDEEGEYYNIRIPPEDENEVERLRSKMQELHAVNKHKTRSMSGQQQQQQLPYTSSSSSSPRVGSGNELSAAMSKEVIKAADFNFLTVLGKGSFGKVGKDFRNTFKKRLG